MANKVVNTIGISIAILVCFLTISYAAFADWLTITSAVAIVRADENVRITSVSTNSGYINNLGYTVSSITNNVSIADGDSVTYAVTVRNLGNVQMAVSGVTFSRGNQTINGVSANIDSSSYVKICDNSLCTINAAKTFNLTITNNTGSVLSGELDVNLIFTPAYNITYSNNIIGEVLEGATFSYTFASNPPSSITVDSGVCGTPQINNNILTIPNVTSDLVLSAGNNQQVITNPDGSQTVITDNGDGTVTKVTTDNDGNVTTQEITYDGNNNEIVTSYEIDTSGNNNGGLVLTSSVIDTGYVLFNGAPFQLHMVYKTTINSNTQKHILSTLKKVSGSNVNNSKYDGFIYYVYKTGTVRMNVLTTDGLSSGYGGVYVADYKLSSGGSGVSSQVYTYTLDASYDSTTKTITATMNPGNNLNGSEQVVKQSNDFPTTLDATLFIG